MTNTLETTDIETTEPSSTKDLIASLTLEQALALAQLEMGSAKKDGKNPHFKSNYATLQSVREASMPLHRYGIAVISGMENDNVITELRKNGDRVAVSIPILGKPANMQQLGSAITYARRYGLLMLAGIAPADDDDGNAAVEAPSIDTRKRDAILARIAGIDSLEGAETASEYVYANWGHDPDVVDALENRKHDLATRA